ncbi:MAG: hydrolase [Pseudomonadota bacterium]
MTDYSPYVNWLDSQHERMCDVLLKWSNVNSGSRNTAGLGVMLEALKQEFQVLGGEPEELDLRNHKQSWLMESESSLQLGKALRIRKRPAAALRVLLCCHMDTVYPQDHPFQKAQRIDNNTMRGPGVTDAKGGMVVMLMALLALEKSPWNTNLGWEVLINPDEEIGSPGSVPVLAKSAAVNHLGLVFEPCFPNGHLVGNRKGSGNFKLVVRGKAAHAGRDSHLGRNAISALAWFIVVLNAFASTEAGLMVNVGYLEGGGPVNVVPDRAECRFNVRVATLGDQRHVEDFLERVTKGIKLIDGLSMELQGGFARPPKMLDSASREVFRHVIECGKHLGLSLEVHASGGACDGNNLAAAGLPTIDSLGVRGAEIHSRREHIFLDSLLERSKLTALLLMKLGSGEITLPARS